MKKQLLNELYQAGVATKYEKHPIWKKAFEYYWENTGDYNLKMGCSTCYIKILEWLRK